MLKLLPTQVQQKQIYIQQEELSQKIVCIVKRKTPKLVSCITTISVIGIAHALTKLGIYKMNGADLDGNKVSLKD